MRLVLNKVNTSAPLQSPATAENGAWRGLPGEGWRRLHGSFANEGMSVEHHRFRTDRELDWGRSFHPDSLEICLNLQGSATLEPAGGEPVRLGVRTAAVYSPGTSAGLLAARRAAGEDHHFVTIELSRGLASERLASSADALFAPVNAYLEAPCAAAPFAAARPMTTGVQNAARALTDPPFAAASPAGRLWYEAKTLELLSLLLFAPADPTPPPLTLGGTAGERFCDRQKRLTRDRIEQARALLERDLENPPNLEMLAAAVGCGAFHLSRAFSQHVGQTIPQYLRQMRLERAARLLREGRGNVSEVAIAVGYQSMSHFSKVFWEHFGCCPGLYGNARLAEVTRAVRRPTRV